MTLISAPYIVYSPSLRIRNTGNLPRGRGLRYLVCVRGPEGSGELVAKRWCRKHPNNLKPSEILVVFTIVAEKENKP